MSDKIKKIELKIEKRIAKIQKYEEALKTEKQMLKKDQKMLATVKYDEILKKLMKNNIDAEDILDKVEEVIEEKETQSSLENVEKETPTDITNGTSSNYNQFK